MVWLARQGLIASLAAAPLPSGLAMYSSDSTTLYSVDYSTGVRTSVAPLGDSIRGLHYYPANGKYYASQAAGSEWYEIDVGDGTLTPINSFLPGVISDSTIDTDGTMYITAFDHLYSIDPVTGNTASIAFIPGSDPGAGLATLDNGSSYLMRGVEIYPITLSTAVTGTPVTLTGDITNGVRAAEVVNNTIYAIDITGNGGAGRLITINPTTGVCSLVGGSGSWLALTSNY